MSTNPITAYLARVDEATPALNMMRLSVERNPELFAALGVDITDDLNDVLARTVAKLVEPGLFAERSLQWIRIFGKSWKNAMDSLCAGVGFADVDKVREFRTAIDELHARGDD